MIASGILEVCKKKKFKWYITETYQVYVTLWGLSFWHKIWGVHRTVSYSVAQKPNQNWTKQGFFVIIFRNFYTALKFVTFVLDCHVSLVQILQKFKLI